MHEAVTHETLRLQAGRPLNLFLAGRLRRTRNLCRLRGAENPGFFGGNRNTNVRCVFVFFLILDNWIHCEIWTMGSGNGVDWMLIVCVAYGGLQGWAVWGISNIISTPRESAAHGYYGKLASSFALAELSSRKTGPCTRQVCFVLCRCLACVASLFVLEFA